MQFVFKTGLRDDLFLFSDCAWRNFRVQQKYLLNAHDARDESP